MTSPVPHTTPATIAPVEPVVTARRRARALRARRRDLRSPRRQHRDGRLRQAQRDQARPDGARMRRACPPRGRAGNGEDRPRARDRREHRGGDSAADPVHAGPPADRRDGPLRLRPADPRLRVQARADLRERRPRRRDQPRDAEDAVRAARGDGRAPGDRRRRDARAAVSVPPPRDGEPDRVRGHVPASRGAARPLLPAHRARLSRGSRTSSASSPSSATRTRSTRSSLSSGSTRCTSSGPRRSTSTSTTCSTAGSSSSCVRPASRSRSSSAARFAAASRSSAQRARGRSSTAAATSCPEDIERLFVPVLVHRVVFTPGFVARARATGWAEAIEEFRHELPRARAASRLRRGPALLRGRPLARTRRESEPGARRSAATPCP